MIAPVRDRPAVRLTAAQIAAHVGGTLDAGQGAGAPEDLSLSGVAGLEEAGPEDLSFLANRRYLRHLRASRAGAILVGPGDPGNGRSLLIRCADPYAAFAKALALFHPRPAPPPGAHPQAVIEGDAAGATVMAFAYVGPGATVGPGTVLQPFVYVGPGARVGRDCLLMAGAAVMDGCEVGDRCVLNPGAVVGAEGFGFAPTPEGLLKIPQTGRAVVGDDVEIGAQSCVDRAAMGDTVVESGAKLDNFVQIGHAARVGARSTLVAYAAVAGTAKIGAGSVLAARTLVLGHLDVAPGTRLGACSMLHESTRPGEQRTGVPARPHADWLRQAAALPRLPDLLARVQQLEQELTDLRRDLRARLP